MLTARPFLAALPRWHGRVDERLFEVGGMFTTGADGHDVRAEGATLPQLQSEFGEYALSDGLASMSEGRGWYQLGHRETAAEAHERIRGVAAWVHRESAAGRPMLVLVVHGDLLSELLGMLLGTRASFLHLNTAMTSLEVPRAADEACTLLFQNRSAHLTDALRTGEEMLAVVGASGSAGCGDSSNSAPG
jgi:broad specificity phosphatase PhoE